MPYDIHPPPSTLHPPPSALNPPHTTLHSELRTIYYLLLTAYHLLLASSYLLSTAYQILPPTYYLLLTTHCSYELDESDYTVRLAKWQRAFGTAAERAAAERELAAGDDHSLPTTEYLPVSRGARARCRCWRELRQM